jgi:hypothetical protein
LGVKESKTVRKSIAVLFQAVAVCLILFESYPKYSPLKTHTSQPKFLCLAAGTTLVSREPSENNSSPFLALKGNLFHSELWMLISRAGSTELITNLALNTPLSLYNTYYNLLRIHAP